MVHFAGLKRIPHMLDDTALNAHQFRMGLSSTRACVCGTDIEDVDHYLLRCPKYNSIRSDLLKSVQDIVTYCIRSSNQGLTASLLLSPWNCEDASKYDCCEILAATFQFIHISRHVSFELYITYTVSFTSTSVIVYEDGKQ